MNVGATAIESVLDITIIESRCNTLLCLTVGGILQFWRPLTPQNIL